ncbi:MAG: hypothetical protein K9J37_12750 [Saprospiraceae bacterium]|nr:hypothetical protein [Saprospiraceae bacterium]MCF8250777.1 hypothetical protein [Saprospiraceae bacterium]MCF8281755.1 hypothetical protein [Bacteroidales bacterium]MCF8312578.1 hypothetical protein [Saprospiraceae bacterium]MCF8440907.1 hypothetical protein [Saprospiraceae bacterium]
MKSQRCVSFALSFLFCQFLSAQSCLTPENVGHFWGSRDLNAGEKVALKLGAVGSSTCTPTFELLAGNSFGTNSFRLRSTGTGASNYYWTRKTTANVWVDAVKLKLNSTSHDFSIFDVANNTEKVKFASNGNSFLLGGSLGIGTTSVPTGYKFAVVGKIIAEEIRVELAGDGTGVWPDYVFQKDYTLLPLNELEKSIQQNGHLPGIPSAAIVKADGIAVGDMQRRLLEKVEELTLYMIQMKKENDELRRRIEDMEKAAKD